MKEPERKKGLAEPDGWRVKVHLLTQKSKVDLERQWTKMEPDV